MESFNAEKIHINVDETSLLTSRRHTSSFQHTAIQNQYSVPKSVVEVIHASRRLFCTTNSLLKRSYANVVT